MRSTLSSLLATLLLAGTVGLAQAQALRPEVGKPLQQAYELIKAGKGKEALAKVREADAAPNKSAAEALQIDRGHAGRHVASGPAWPVPPGAHRRQACGPGLGALPFHGGACPRPLRLRFRFGFAGMAWRFHRNQRKPKSTGVWDDLVGDGIGRTGVSSRCREIPCSGPGFSA